MFGSNPGLAEVKEWINDHSESNDELQGKAAGWLYLRNVSSGSNFAWEKSRLYPVPSGRGLPPFLYRIRSASFCPLETLPLFDLMQIDPTEPSLSRETQKSWHSQLGKPTDKKVRTGRHAATCVGKICVGASVSTSLSTSIAALRLRK